VASSFLVDQSAVVSAEGQGAEALFLWTKAEPDNRCTVHELVRCGQTRLLLTRLLLTQHRFASAARSPLRCSQSHQSGRSRASTWPEQTSRFLRRLLKGCPQFQVSCDEPLFGFGNWKCFQVADRSIVVRAGCWWMERPFIDDVFYYSGQSRLATRV